MLNLCFLIFFYENDKNSQKSAAKLQKILDICKFFRNFVRNFNNLVVFTMKYTFKLTIFLLFFGVMPLFAQKSVATSDNVENATADYLVRCVAFYNLENLFDTIHDFHVTQQGDTIHKNDYEYLPNGAMHWTGYKYRNKLNRMAYAISRFGEGKTSLGAAIIGVSEVENIRALNDLADKLNTDYNMPYKAVLLEGPDRRGVDVGFLYNPQLFIVSGKPIPYNLEAHYSNGNKVYSRFQLLLSGYLKDDNGALVRDKIHVIVNHWPSRYGGEEQSRATRDTAAMLCMHIVDSLYLKDPNAKIIIMGDLNDDPYNHSCAEVLNAKMNREDVAKQGLFNTMWLHLEHGVGSLAYNGSWNLFDQIIISEPLLNAPHSATQWTYWKSEVFNKDFLTVQESKDKGTPLRTHKAGVWQNGYGDHYPTMIYLIKNK